MITLQFVAVWLGWLLAAGSPGPATMGIAGTAMEAGRKQALVFSAGILFRVCHLGDLCGAWSFGLNVGECLDV